MIRASIRYYRLIAASAGSELADRVYDSRISYDDLATVVKACANNPDIGCQELRTIYNILDQSYRETVEGG